MTEQPWEEKYARPKEIYQRIRCARCTHRIAVQPGQKEAWCPECGLGWVLTWITPEIPMFLRRIMPT